MIEVKTGSPPKKYYSVISQGSIDFSKLTIIFSVNTKTKGILNPELPCIFHFLSAALNS